MHTPRSCFRAGCIAFATAVFGLPAPGLAQTQTAVLPVLQDASIYEEDEVANGGGNLIVGRTAGRFGTSLRRALLRFDLGALPPKATIESAELTLSVVRRSNEAPQEPVSVSLHPLSGPWAEGSGNGGGRGRAPLASEDATWSFARWQDRAWTQAGGDFATPADSVLMIALQTSEIAHSSSGLIDRLNSWLQGTTAPYGWLLIGDEALNASIVQFAPREHPTETVRPRLEITFSGGFPWPFAQTGAAFEDTYAGFVSTAAYPWAYSVAQQGWWDVYGQGGGTAWLAELDTAGTRWLYIEPGAWPYAYDPQQGTWVLK